MASNQTPPIATDPRLPPSDTAMLEAIVPGYTLISRFFLSYMQVDLTAYLQILVALALFGASMRYSYQFLLDLFKGYFTSTAEIRLDDEIFNYFMYWMSRQPHMKRTNRFVAGLKSNGYWSDEDDSDDEAALEDAEDEWDEPGSGATADSFDDYWAKVVSRDKYKPLRFTPSQGSHYFWYRSRPLVVERKSSENTSRWVLNNERLYLSCLGRDPSILKTLLAEAQRAYVERDGNRTIIYRGARQMFGSSLKWVRCMARSPRPLSTVVLDQGQKQGFVDDIKEYLHPRTRRWYSNRGIPYRRGYLLHGPPGTGKTSLCFAAAGLLGLKLYLLNLNSKALDEDCLATLFSELPRRCIVLLEDVDTAGITHTRGKTAVAEPSKDEEAILPNLPEEPSSSSPGDADGVIDEPEQNSITLSGLLNVIDGVAASEGRILVMTTNHADKLDPALLRPGRVDMSIAFGRTSRADIQELFSSIYMTMEGDLPRASASRRLSNGSAKPGSRVTATEDSNQMASVPDTDEKYEKVKANETEEIEQRLQSVRKRITVLAAEFAAVVPSDEFTAAEIQGYLLNHKNSPEAAIMGAGAWVHSVQEKKHAREEKLV